MELTPLIWYVKNAAWPNCIHFMYRRQRKHETAWCANIYATFISAATWLLFT